MNAVSETIKINRLIDIYGKLLTTSQYEIMLDYYQYNLSLGEISENRNISRTAVQDTIKKATNKLENYEEKIGICKVFDSCRDKNNADLLDLLEERIKNGI